jgi:hypothetical protein
VVNRELMIGYIWLISGSACFFARCLLDLALERRPALGANLTLPGLAWMAGAFLICLIFVAYREPETNDRPMGKTSTVLDQASRRTADTVTQFTGQPDEDRVYFWVVRSVAISCHVAIVVALILIGAIQFQSANAGMSAATAYLLLPYTAYNIDQAHHALPAALLTWAVFCYRRPWLTGLLLGIATGMFFFPLFVLPVWLSFYRGRGAERFLGSFLLTAGASVGLSGLVLWLDGQLAEGLHLTLSHSEWHLWSVTAQEGIWRGVHGAYRLPVFIGYMAFVLTTMAWPSPKNLAHAIALTAAALIGIQFWYADQGGVYVLWYLPLLLLVVFRPTLTDRHPPVPVGRSFLARVFGWIVGRLMPRTKPPEPLAPVAV